MAYTVFVIGNIASGKSSACRYLASLGARHIDLDQLVKDLYISDSALVHDIAAAFGWDVLDEDGRVRTSILASRAFSTPESTRLLNDIVHPVVREHLSALLLSAECCSVRVPDPPLTVVEVSAPSSFCDAFGLADEVIAITAPLELRRERAFARGMSYDDFEARSAVQPSEDELLAMADYAIDNSTSGDDLHERLNAWLCERGMASQLAADRS